MDLLGASLSLPAAILGGVQGQLGSFFHKWLDYKYEVKLAEFENQENARNAKGSSLLGTRKTISIITCIYIFIGPWVASYWGIPVCFTYGESNGWFMWAFKGSSSTHIEQVTGFVITPFQCYLASLQWSMYFGGRSVERFR